MAEWIGRVVFDPTTEAKLTTKHDLTPRDVEEAVALGQHHWAGWEDHPEYGERLVAIGTTVAGGKLIAYLRPIDRTDGVWECLTAWRLE